MDSKETWGVWLSLIANTWTYQLYKMTIQCIVQIRILMSKSAPSSIVALDSARKVDICLSIAGLLWT